VKRHYLLTLLVSVDQFFNALFRGSEDETISSRVGKRRNGNERFWAKVIDKLFFWQKNHTANSIEADEGK